MFINLFIFYLFIYLFIYLFKSNQIKFSCTDNITARNSKTKYYEELHLSGCRGGFRTSLAVQLVQHFCVDGFRSDIVDFLH